MPVRRLGFDLLVGGFPARCGWRVIARNPALNPMNGFAIPELSDVTLGNLAETGQLGDRKPNLFKGYLGRCRNFAIEQLAMFFQVLED